MTLALVSGVGHGALGLRSGLPTFEDLIDRSSSERDVFLEFRPALLISGWSVHSGACYSAALDKVFGGMRRDVVAVRTLLDTGLVRAESLADCIATTGTFFYDPDELFDHPAFGWNIGVNWNDGYWWNQFSKVYIHLEDASDPGNTSVVVAFGFYFSGRGQVHPALGPDKLTDGGLENWADATTLSDWAKDGATTTTRVDALRAGSYACEITGAADGGIKEATLSVEAGALYRLSGAYQTEADESRVSPAVRIFDDNGSEYLQGDGRSYDAAAYDFSLNETHGPPVRWSLDFRAHSSATTVTVFLRRATTKTLTVDDLRLQRIWRFNYYEPRLGRGSIPSLRTGSGGLFGGRADVGVGSVSFLNTDARFDLALGQLVWINQEVRVDVGGRKLDGREVMADDWERQFVGLIRRPDFDDNVATFQVQDFRATLHRELPLRTYLSAENPDLEPSAEGEPRPLLFGLHEGLERWRTALESTHAKYGIYELADMGRAPNDLLSVDAVYAYADKAAADAVNTTRRKLLTNPTDYTEDLATGLVTIKLDCGPYEVTPDNNVIDFSDGVARVATLTVGLYTAAGLATEIQTQMDAASADNITAVYSDTTNLFTLASDGGVFSLLCKTGANKTISTWKLIGFQKSADRPSAASHAGDDVTFTSADDDHVIRFDAQGFKDTAAGKYTGSANALIERGPDLVQLIWEQFLGRPYSSIDQASFVAARALTAAPMAIDIRTPISTQTVFEVVARGNLATIIIGGDGALFYQRHTTTVASDAVVLEDRDFLGGFKTSLVVAEIYGSVLVKYAQTAARWRKRTVTDGDVELLYKRGKTLTVETYLRVSNDATALALALLDLAKAPPRRFAVPVSSKLLRHKVGDQLRVSRDRGIDPSGELDAVAVRILEISRNVTAGTVEVQVAEVEEA